MKLSGTHTADTGPLPRSRKREHAFSASLFSNTIGLPRRTAMQPYGVSTEQPGAPFFG